MEGKSHYYICEILNLNTRPYLIFFNSKLDLSSLASSLFYLLIKISKLFSTSYTRYKKNSRFANAYQENQTTRKISMISMSCTYLVYFPV